MTLLIVLMSLSKCAIHFIVSSWVIYLYLSAVLCSHLEELVFPLIFRWPYFGRGLASCALLTDRTRCIFVPWQKKKSRGIIGVNWGNGGVMALLSSALTPHLYVGGVGKPRSGLKIWVGVIGDSPTDRLFPSLFVFVFSQSSCYFQRGRGY